MNRALPILAALSLLALSGCASIEQAGHASYTVKSYAASDGSKCCELLVRDGKEYAGRTVAFQSNGQTTTLMIQEGASKAFPGQALAVKALTVLPVSGLQELLK